MKRVSNIIKKLETKKEVTVEINFHELEALIKAGYFCERLLNGKYMITK